MQINRQQFNKIAADLAEWGGFSANVAGPGATGEGPSGRSYLVGGYKGGFQDFPPSPPLTGQDIESWSSQPPIHEPLSEPNVLLGGFVGKEPPRQALDVTEQFDANKRGSRYSARIATAERNQEGYGVTDASGDYKHTVQYPYYVPGASQAGRNADLFDASWSTGKGTDKVWKEMKSTPSAPKDKGAPRKKKYNPASDPNAMQITGMEDM
jgi:hypothetical protein